MEYGPFNSTFMHVFTILKNVSNIFNFDQFSKIISNLFNVIIIKMNW